MIPVYDYDYDYDYDYSLGLWEEEKCGDHHD
jgi:hypothetical protein